MHNKNGLEEVHSCPSRHPSFHCIGNEGFLRMSALRQVHTSCFAISTESMDLTKAQHNTSS